MTTKTLDAKSVTWHYRCVYPEYFELMLRYLPEEPWPWLKELLVSTDRDRGDLVGALTVHATQLRPRWPWRIRTDFLEEQTLSTYQLPGALVDYFDLSLGVKVLLPLCTEAPFFYTDDDIVVPRDPGYLMTEGPWMSFSGLDSIGDSNQGRVDLDFYRRVTWRPDLTLEEFNRRRTDAGAWFIPHLDREAYVELLRRFFGDPRADIVRDSFTRRGVKNAFRLLDQRFLSCCAILMPHVRKLTGPHYRAMPTKKRPARRPDATIIHYCASGQKPEYVRWLREQLEVRA